MLSNLSRPSLATFRKAYAFSQLTLPNQSASVRRVCGFLPHPYRSYTVSQHFNAGQSTLSPSPLSPSILSLYRLFLRSTAASVLSHPEATTALRRLWKPAFVHATAVMRELESDTLLPEQREALTHWLAEWETRVDNTLSLLYSSAVARGLPHRVIRNLHRLRVANITFIDPPRHLQEGGVWDGQLPPDDPMYKPSVSRRKKERVKSARQKKKEHFADRAMDVLSDIIGMAEGSGSVSMMLGRVQRRR